MCVKSSNVDPWFLTGNLADFYIPKPDSSVDGLWRDLDTRITDLMRTHLHLRDEKGKLLPRRACLIRSTHLPKTLITPELLEKVSPGSGFIDLEETPNAGVLPLCPFKQVLECIKNLASSGELNMTRIKQFWLYLLEDVSCMLVKPDRVERKQALGCFYSGIPLLLPCTILFLMRVYVLSAPLYHLDRYPHRKRRSVWIC